jgi:hypothetical protein
MKKKEPPEPPEEVNEDFTDEQAGPYIGVKPETLVAWRHRGQGPRYVKVGRLRRYRKADLDQWKLEQTVTKQEMEARRKVHRAKS